MQVPPCGHETYIGKCVRCYHFRHTENYRVAHGGDSLTKDISCKYLGKAIPDNFDTCKTCKGTIELPVFQCSIFEECNPNPKRSAQIVQNCKSCPSYERLKDND